MSALKISNLSKTYANGVKALNGITLDIPIGLFGLLGPNGAGKSTLMRTLATLQVADAGSIYLGPLNVLEEKQEIRKVLGYLPQEFGLYPKITAEDLLHHLAILKGITHKGTRKALVQELLHKTNLYEKKKHYLGSFSGGMKQRFGIAQALLSNPKLLIVDEPTAGLDPMERNRFYNLLSALGEDTIVILSTHIVEDVKELCPEMAIINQGKVLMKGNPITAMEELNGRLYQKSIPKNELEDYKTAFHVIADKYYLGQPVISILSDIDPGDGFVAIAAGLEELYFSHIQTK